MPLPARKERLVVVSNRLPFVLAKGEDGEWRITPGAGGLVTALLPVLRDRGGVWIGWPGAHANVEEVQHAFRSAESATRSSR